MAYYAIPDIHGNLKGLNNALEIVLKDFNPKEDMIVFLGDYVDRGVNSHGVLKRMFELQKEYGSETVVCLMGNHDEMFIQYLENPHNTLSLYNDYKLYNVLSFCGEHFSLNNLKLHYNNRILDFNTGEDYTEKVAKYINAKHSELLEWYKKLPMYLDKVSDDNVLFVHAGIEEVVLGLDWKTYTTDDQLLWKYPPTYGENPYGFDIVCGHIITSEFWKFSDSPVYDIYKSGNHIYVDGGSPRNKKLNILKVADGKFYDWNTKLEII